MAEDVSKYLQSDRGHEPATGHEPAPTHPSAGKHTLVGQTHMQGGRAPGGQIQASGGHVHGAEPRAQHGIATGGISGSSSSFPHRATIEGLFGRPVPATAHTDAAAATATGQLGTEAYAYGNAVAFRSPSPGLHVAAHEAAHVVQQQAGVQLSGGVGARGDIHERHADAVADRVVAGKSAADLLDGLGGGGGATRGVQCYDNSAAPQEEPVVQPLQAQAPAQQGPAQQGPAQQGPAQQQPGAGQPAPQQGPTPAQGHQPGQDYTRGTVRVRTFVRAADLTTIEMVNRHRVVFVTGTAVELVAAHPTQTEWVQVRGPAFEETSPQPTAIAAPVTGWIQRRSTDMTLGVFQDLGVTDRTRDLGGLSQQPLPHADVNNIVLHQTDSSSQQSTLNAYQSRIAQNSTIGAQYLIGETGEISNITGIDRRVSHVRPDLPSGANSNVDNSHSIGIEHVGMHRSIAPAPNPPAANAPAAQQQAWTTAMQRVRNDILALPLSPGFRDRLLALNDRALFQTMRSNGWNVYVDINGAQKRSSYLLTQRLRAEFGLGQNDLYGHEDVQQKTQGEGENIREFLVAREAYPGQVQALRNLANTRPDLRASAPFMAVLQREEALVQALAVDATSAENTALAAERAAGRGGAATGREDSRLRYYDDFWNRVAQLRGLLQFLSGPNASDATQLNALLAAWRI